MIIKAVPQSFSSHKARTTNPVSTSLASKAVKPFATQVSTASQADRSAARNVEPTGKRGQVTDVSRVVGFKEHPLGSFKVPDYLIEELDRRAKEESIREAINFKYASENRYKTVGQIYVDGKFFAEVDSGGTYGSIHAIRGLSQEDMAPQDRIAEIASALQKVGRVEVRHSNFGPGLGGWIGPSAPEHLLPAYTARSGHEIFQEIQKLFEIQKTEYLAAQASHASTISQKA